MEINKMDKLIKLQMESDQHDNKGLHKSSEETKSEYAKIISHIRKTKDSQSFMSDNYDEYDNYNYDECYEECSSDKESIRSTFED